MLTRDVYISVGCKTGVCCQIALNILLYYRSGITLPSFYLEIFTRQVAIWNIITSCHACDGSIGLQMEFHQYAIAYMIVWGCRVRCTKACGS